MFSENTQQCLIYFLGMCVFFSIVRWWMSFQVYVKITMTFQNNYQPACKWNKSLGHPIFVNRTVPQSLEILQREYPEIQNGGWKPRGCHNEEYLAIIIPYRERENNLKVFLQHYHSFLQTQNANYRIFVIEQIDESPFNRAKLLNIGFKEAKNFAHFTCFIFHDVDLLSEDTRNIYGCRSSPRHLCPAVDTLGYVLFSNRLFGGVVAFTQADFQKVNGFSNRYWGWGSEDDDMYWRLYYAGVTFSRPSMEVGRYQMLGHSKQETNEKGIKRLLRMEKGELKAESDGVTTLQYRRLDRIVYSLFINIKVDLMMTDEEKTLTTVENKKSNKTFT